MGVGVDICYGVSRSPIILGIRMGGDFGCRGVWIFIKVGHKVHITDQTLYIIVLDLFFFEVF